MCRNTCLAVSSATTARPNSRCSILTNKNGNGGFKSVTMANRYNLLYEFEGEYRVKEIQLPDSTTSAKSNKLPRRYGRKFGVLVTYKAGKRKKTRIVRVPKKAEDISLEFFRI